MKEGKFGSDVAYARNTIQYNTIQYPSVHTIHVSRRKMSDYFGAKANGHPLFVTQSTTKESIKTKTESGKCFCIRVV